MKQTIKDCNFCAAITRNICERPKMKHIIANGPHYIYQADIWEIDKEISEKIQYKYILDIKDSFSKWLWSYPLLNKEGSTVLRYIKNYFLSFGKPEIIQTDNGLEFNNQISKIYYENINVKHINSSPRYPESNGQIGSQHKTVQKAIKIDLESKKNDFNIHDCINNCLENYNYNIVHTSTGYIPFQLKDVTDVELINKVNNKIILLTSLEEGFFLIPSKCILKGLI